MCSVHALQILPVLFPQSFPAKPSPSFPFLLRCLEYIKTVNHVIAQSVNYVTLDIIAAPTTFSINSCIKPPSPREVDFAKQKPEGVGFPPQFPPESLTHGAGELIMQSGGNAAKLFIL